MSADETRLEAMRQTVRRAAEKNPQIRGSLLGMTLRADHPDVDVKLMFGGLAQFLKSRCEDIVEWYGKDGGDDLYKSLICPEMAVPTAASQVTPWRAFVNASLQVPLYLLPGSVGLLVGGDAPAGGLLIEPISLAEHRQIAESFLDKCPSHFAPQLKEVLSRADYWQHWLRALATDKEIQRQWMSHRKAGILDLFRNRLTAHQVTSEESLEHLIVALADVDSRRHTPPSARRDISQVSSTRRRLLHQLVDAMSEQDLQQIWVPMSAVDHVFRRLQMP